jgi:hypothetical protein
MLCSLIGFGTQPCTIICTLICNIVFVVTPLCDVYFLNHAILVVKLIYQIYMRASMCVSMY